MVALVVVFGFDCGRLTRAVDVCVLGVSDAAVLTLNADCRVLMYIRCIWIRVKVMIPALTCLVESRPHVKFEHGTVPDG